MPSWLENVAAVAPHVPNEVGPPDVAFAVERDFSEHGVKRSRLQGGDDRLRIKCRRPGDSFGPNLYGGVGIKRVIRAL